MTSRGSENMCVFSSRRLTCSVTLNGNVGLKVAKQTNKHTHTHTQTERERAGDSAHLNHARILGRLHSARDVHRVAPHVVVELVCSNNSCCDGACKVKEKVTQKFLMMERTTRECWIWKNETKSIMFFIFLYTTQQHNNTPSWMPIRNENVLPNVSLLKSSITDTIFNAKFASCTSGSFEFVFQKEKRYEVGVLLNKELFSIF